MDIKKIIAEVEGRLTWDIKITFIPDGDEEIISDPWERMHHIRVPVAGHRDIEYLHELAHATLAERHHLLATAIFSGTITGDIYDQLVCPIRCASDWYADALLMQWVPDEEMAEIREHLKYFRPEIILKKAADPFVMYGGGLIWAQAVYYLGYDPAAIPEEFRHAAMALLYTDPGNPSVEVKRNLINSLAALTCAARLEIVNEDGFDVWRVI